MKRIPQELRDAILAKLTGPDRKSVAQVAIEEKMSPATIYNWRKKSRIDGSVMPNKNDTPEGWSAQDKFQTVLQTSSLSQNQLAQYCQEQGIYPEQLQRW